MIGIIGAMDTEVDNIKAQVKGKTVSFIAGVEFVCGFIEDVTVLSTGLMLLKLKLTKKYPSFWQGLRFPAVKKYTAAQLQAAIPLFQAKN